MNKMQKAGLFICAFIVVMLGLMMSASGHLGGGIVLVICGIGMVASILSHKDAYVLEGEE